MCVGLCHFDWWGKTFVAVLVVSSNRLLHYILQTTVASFRLKEKILSNRLVYSIIKQLAYYRSQRSCGKVMFLHLSVCHSVHRGWGVSATPRADIPGQTPPRQTPLGRPPWADTPLPSACWDTHTPLGSACWDTVNKRAVRIPLECILVHI